jgi:hypothetical protein
MSIVASVCFLVALVLFVIAGSGINTDRFAAGWLGLAFLTAALMAVGGFHF